MASLDELVGRIAEQSSLEEAVALLVADLAERIKATSNDQNSQKLARDLNGVKSALVRAVAAKHTATKNVPTKHGSIKHAGVS